MKSKLLLFGTSPFGVPSFSVLNHTEHLEIVGVVTQPGKPVGRAQTITPTAVEVWAHDQQLPVFTFASLKNEAVQKQLRDLHADVFVVASYGLILPQAVLDIPPKHCLNIHASLLPRWRGASPIAHSILNGDTETGITFMLMDAGCDTGPILRQYPLRITPHITRPELEQQLSDLAAQHAHEIVVGWLNNTLTGVPQPTSDVSTTKKLQREDGLATWENAEALERKMMAFTPWPGLWTTWGDRQIKILSARVNSQKSNEVPGTVVQIEKSWGIACQDGILEPLEVQFSGKKPQPAIQIPGSYPNFIGARLGS